MAWVLIMKWYFPRTGPPPLVPALQLGRAAGERLVGARAPHHHGGRDRGGRGSFLGAGGWLLYGHTCTRTDQPTTRTGSRQPVEQSAAKRCGRRRRWASSASNHTCVVWRALLDRRSRQQTLPVGNTRPETGHIRWADRVRTGRHRGHRRHSRGCRAPAAHATPWGTLSISDPNMK
jgi:hypothetical protein